MKPTRMNGYHRAAKQASRREFLKVSALAAGAVAFGPPLILRGANAAATTTANSKLNIALVGCGSQGRGDIKNCIGPDARVVALCDPDENQISAARTAIGPGAKDAAAYGDYRKLLDDAKTFDAVLIATPDHWHAPLCKAFMKAGKHVYCEKPLTHTIAEARDLRDLAAHSKVVTQLGNQGSASSAMRRSLELIKAGALGQIFDIYQWGIGYSAEEGNAPGEDPVPAGFNWDMWLGPVALRPYKAGTYHPHKWRHWFDLGEGGVGDFGCHSLNLPLRALDLSYPEQVVLNVKDGQQFPGKAALEFRFAARGSLVPLTYHWQGGGKPPQEIMQPVVEVYPEKTPAGVMIMGEKGCIYTNLWNANCLIRLQGEPRLKDVLHHPATQDIPLTVPRAKSHYEEWVNACRGQGKTFSPFQFGGLLTEIVLSGIVALRTGKTLDWDGEKMQARNVPEAAKFVRTEYRTKWLA